jgi:hypothetical protein
MIAVVPLSFRFFAIGIESNTSGLGACGNYQAATVAVVTSDQGKGNGNGEGNGEGPTLNTQCPRLK